MHLFNKTETLTDVENQLRLPKGKGGGGRGEE